MHHILQIFTLIINHSSSALQPSLTILGHPGNLSPYSSFDYVTTLLQRWNDGQKLELGVGYLLSIIIHQPGDRHRGGDGMGYRFLDQAFEWFRSPNIFWSLPSSHSLTTEVNFKSSSYHLGQPNALLPTTPGQSLSPPSFVMKSHILYNFQSTLSFFTFLCFAQSAWSWLVASITRSSLISIRTRQPLALGTCSTSIPTHIPLRNKFVSFTLLSKLQSTNSPRPPAYNFIFFILTNTQSPLADFTRRPQIPFILPIAYS